MFDDLEQQPELRPVPTTPLADRTWWQIWSHALTKPNLEAYEDLLHDSGVSFGRAFVWMGVVSVLTSVGYTLLALVLDSQGTRLLLEMLGLPSDDTAIILTTPVVVVMNMGLWLLTVNIPHRIALILGGTGELKQVAFLNAAYQAPIQLLTFIFSLNATVSLCIVPLFWLGQIWLGVVTVNATHRCGWVRAATAYFVLPFTLLLLGLCLLGILVMAAVLDANSAQDALDILITPTPTLD